MDNNSKKEYLLQMFTNLSGEDIGWEEHESIRWFEQRNFTRQEAKQKVREQLQAILMEDNEIVNTILNYRATHIEAYINLDGSQPTRETMRHHYIDYLSSTFSCICDFSINDGKLIDPNNVVEAIRKVFITNEIVNGTHATEELPKEEGEKLSIKIIALLHIYSGRVITKENATELIKPYGHFSGDKLYNEYTSFMTVSRRQCLPEPYTPRKFHNRVALFEKVIELLPEGKKGVARKDLQHIRDKYEQ